MDRNLPVWCVCLRLLVPQIRMRGPFDYIFSQFKNILLFKLVRASVRASVCQFAIAYASRMKTLLWCITYRRAVIASIMILLPRSIISKCVHKRQNNNMYSVRPSVILNCFTYAHKFSYFNFSYSLKKCLHISQPTRLPFSHLAIFIYRLKMLPI